MLLHATLTSKVGRARELSETVAWLARGMESPAMRLAGAWETTMSVPGRIVDLWQLADANTIVDALEHAQHHPKHQATMDRLAESVAREQLRLVEPTPYSPEFVAPGADARLLHVTLRVRYGQHGRLFPALVERGGDVPGARLVGAFRTVIGDFAEVFELWELPPDGFPDIASGLDLPELVEAADAVLMRPTAYSPSTNRSVDVG